ncbi:hypothetical protein DDD63_02555 [Actinobaculum sp. 313]|nr:hypothetical protein DDD63_02555 [Actinobaculum sp. 313]
MPPTERQRTPTELQRKGRTMRMTYDDKVDVAYIALVDEFTGDFTIVQSVTGLRHPEGINPVEIALDLDVKGRLVGIKILHAKQGVPPEFLTLCERINP